MEEEERQDEELGALVGAERIALDDIWAKVVQMALRTCDRS